MAGYRDLREGFDAYLARKISARPTQTGPSGVIDLGARGDVQWNEEGEGGTTYSIKGLPTYITDAVEQGISTPSKANTVSTSPPPGTSEGYPEGAWWIQVVSAADPTVLAVWQEEGGVWVEQPYDGGLVAPTIDAGLINVAVLAAQMILTRVLQTQVDSATGLYAVLDSFGLQVIDSDGGPEGEESTLIQLGPSAENLMQIGSGEDMVNINSAGGISARTISAREFWLNGRRVSSADAFDAPRGVVSRAVLFGGYSRWLQGRDSVLGLDATLQPGRIYKLHTSSVVCDSPDAAREPFLSLHCTTDGSWPGANWGGTTVKETKIGPFSGFRSLPGMEYWVDLTGMDPGGPTLPLRATLTLADFSNAGVVRVAATLDRVYLMVEDMGTRFQDRGAPYFDTGGGGDIYVPTRYTTRWNADAWRTYFRGGAMEGTAVTPVQGQYSSYNREAVFYFPSMTAALAGATIHRITLRSVFDHWAEGGGGTGSWNWHGETGIAPSSPAKTFMRDEVGWPRGAAREAQIIPSEFAAWRDGVRRGFAFSTPATDLTHYGRPSADLSQTWIEAEYSK